MDWNQVEGKWNELSESFGERFGPLTQERLAKLGGRKHQLLEALRDTYGQSEEEAEADLENWRKSLDDDGAVPTSTSGAPTY